jgi:hypothetical protein
VKGRFILRTAIGWLAHPRPLCHRAQPRPSQPRPQHPRTSTTETSRNATPTSTSHDVEESDNGSDTTRRVVPSLATGGPMLLAESRSERSHDHGGDTECRADNGAGNYQGSPDWAAVTAELCGGGWDATGVAPSRKDRSTVVVGPRHPVQLGSAGRAARLALGLEVGPHHRFRTRVPRARGSPGGSRARGSPIGLGSRLGTGLGSLDRAGLGVRFGRRCGLGPRLGGAGLVLAASVHDEFHC